LENPTTPPAGPDKIESFPENYSGEIIPPAEVINFKLASGIVLFT